MVAEEIDQLFGRLKDPQAYVRRRAAENLGRRGEQAARAVPALIDFLADDLFGSRGVRALQQIGPVAVPHVVEAVARHRSAAVRAAAASVLEPFIRSVAVQQALLDALEDAELSVRLRAATALLHADVERQRLISVFVAGLGLGRLHSRWACTHGLSQLGRSAVSAVPALRKWADDPEIGHAAQYAIRSITHE